MVTNACQAYFSGPGSIQRFVSDSRAYRRDLQYIQRTSSFMNFIVIIRLAENELYLRQQVFYRALSIQICRI